MPDTRSWGNSMIRESYFSSAGAGLIRVRTWEPEGAPIGIVQIIHGIVEHVERYNDFAKYLNQLGYLVVAEDHMGHGKSGGNDCARGYFYGGWFAAVDDSYRLLRDTMDQYPGLPYVLLGHSMGSFMARTILAKYPNSGISGAVLSGTGWMPEFVLKAWIRDLCYIMDSDAWAVCFLVFLALTFAMTLLFILAPRAGGRRAGFFTGLVMLVFAVFSLTFSIWQKRDSMKADDAVVMRPVTSVRSSPSSESSTDLFILHEGTKVRIIDAV